MAKVNRYTRLSPSSFTPRSVEEIMMVPMAKQAQHNQLENELGKLEDFEFNRVSGDNEAATQELADFRQRVGEAVDTLASKGISGSNRAALKDLNRELKGNLAQGGKWSKKIAYYDAQKAWVDKMGKKENRGKWAPAEVDRFIGKFMGGSSVDKEGKDTPFQGGALPEYIDQVDYIRKGVKDISESTLKEFGIVHKASINFTDLYSDDTITGKQRNDILNHIQTQARNDKRFMASVQMQNQISGYEPEEDPLAFGEYVTEKDEFSGEERTQYKPASNLDALMFSGASAEAFEKRHKKTISIKDDYGVAKMKADMKAQIEFNKGTGVINVNGHAIEDISYEDYNELVFNSKNIKESLESASKDLAKLEATSGTSSQLYKDTKASVDELQDSLYNLDLKIQFATDKGVEALSEEDRMFFNASKEWEKYKESSYDELGEEERDAFFSEKGIDLKRKEKTFHRGSKTIKVSGYGDEMKRINKEINDTSLDAIRNDKLKGKGAYIYSTFSSNDLKGFNQTVNTYQKSLSGENFDMSKFAGSDGLTLDKVIDLDEFDKTVGKTELVMDKTEVSFSSSNTFNGNPEFVVTFVDARGVKRPGIKVTMGADGTAMYKDISDSLLRSPNYQDRELGNKLKYNTMKGLVSSSGMRTFASVKDGKFPGYEFNGKKTSWNRYKDDLGNARFTVNLNGKESKELRDTDDVEKYLFMVDKMTNEVWEPSEREYWAERFYNEYKEEELRKYLEIDSEDIEKE